MLAPIVLLGSCLTALGDGEVRLNQIQVIGTHNSYHVAPCESVMGLIAAGGHGRAEGLDYTHRPLAEQFSALGVRQIELDVFADPEGGHFARPAAREILRASGRDLGPDPNERGRLDKPGLKVLHVPDVDYLSRTATFVEALAQVREWSRANPRHVPILVLVELKDEPIAGLPTRPIRFDSAALDSVDAEILSVFDREAILAPDDVRGPDPTLPEAIRTRGWPTLDSSRGKVMFALDNEGAIRDRYLEGHAALAGRIMFASVDPADPAAAWFKVNDPVEDHDRIRALVADGFLVRTRSDADTRESRLNDPKRREDALSSGAQFVSTDYPEPREPFSPYRVRFEGGVVARANPVSGDPTLAGKDLERRASREPGR